ncbi:MAG: GFA family protein [Gammaproteobacteria bacterium]|jgi:hypothetical protein|nr:GFA family protein [Gammaproteobacteria bacterium]
MTETIFEGGCLCGAIRYRASAPPMRAVICHCSMCRKHTGAPIASFVHFPIDSFTWLKEQPKRYRSSEFAERGFCSQCGSTVTMHEEVLSDRVQVAIGSLDQPDRVAVNDHVWTQDQISWLDVRDDLPRFHQSGSAVPTKAI